MGQALYRKYRSRSLEELVGQEHVTNTLSQAIKQNKISHAYLLTGPRGVGKTSIARILAHEVNNIPYSDDSAHIDIIEIDAASNRRIDEIRELRDKVNIAPTSAKYKVYIIDEVHMLTKEAFNALLKTLEEPPAHVIFILATTDAHKLPDTIVSRTQRFNFKPVEKSKVIKHLKYIAGSENIKVSDEALQILAEHGEGSFRDSISLLDQASSQANVIESDDIFGLLGIPPREAISQLINSLGSNSATIAQSLQILYDQGYEPATIAKQLSSQLRGQILANSNRSQGYSTLALLEELLRVPSSGDPARLLEICLLKTSTVDVADAPKPPTPQEKPAQVAKTPAIEKPHMKASLPKPTKPSQEDIWPNVLSLLKQKHNTLYGVVRMAEPSFEDNTLNLAFAFAFHQKRSNESANRQKLADILYEVTGKKYSIECIFDAKAKPPKLAVSTKKPESNSDLSTISNIFGKAELLES